MERDSFEQIKRALRSKGITAGGGEGSRTKFYDPSLRMLGTRPFGRGLAIGRTPAVSPDIDDYGHTREWHIGKITTELRSRGQLGTSSDDPADHGLTPDEEAEALGTPLSPIRDDWSESTSGGDPDASHPYNAIAQASVEPFRDDEDGYLRWIAQNQSGYVVNTRRNPTPNYLQLHVATCDTISSPRDPGAYTEHQYIKFCSMDRRALEWPRGASTDGQRRHRGGIA